MILSAIVLTQSTLNQLQPPFDLVEAIDIVKSVKFLPELLAEMFPDHNA